MKSDISFVLKSGHFHLLTTLPDGPPRCEAGDGAGCYDSGTGARTPGRLGQELYDTQNAEIAQLAAVAFNPQSITCR